MKFCDCPCPHPNPSPASGEGLIGACRPGRLVSGSTALLDELLKE
ncbi:hypothetical protein [Lysobacter gummosus]